MAIITLDDVIRRWGSVHATFSDLTELYETCPELAQGWPAGDHGQPAYGTDLYNHTEGHNSTRFVVTFAHAAKDRSRIWASPHDVTGRIVSWNESTGEATIHGDACSYADARALTDAPLQGSEDGTTNNDSIGATSTAVRPAQSTTSSELEPSSASGYSVGGRVVAIAGVIVSFFLAVDLVSKRHLWGESSEPLVELLFLIPLVANLAAWFFSKGHEEVMKIFRRDVLPTVATLMLLLFVVVPGVSGAADDMKKAVSTIAVGLIMSALHIQSFKVLLEAIAVAWRRRHPRK